MTDLFDPLTPPNPAATAPKCRRHEWVPCPWVSDKVTHWCGRCGRWRDEQTRSLNRRNRQRGSSFERTVAKRLGGRRTGPLGGRDDVMVGEFAAVQTKRTLRLSPAEVRRYLEDLSRTYPNRVALVVHALPGERDGVVSLRLSDWTALHGPDEPLPTLPATDVAP